MTKVMSFLEARVLFEKEPEAPQLFLLFLSR